MVGKFDKVNKAYEFFKQRRAARKEFTIDELTAATGWGTSTVKTYATKRWQSFLKKSTNGFVVSPAFDTYSVESFRQHHSQKEVVRASTYQLLVDKSVAACVSAIEIYNKPDFHFREEAFSILMVNAWELLLKAKILKDNSDRLSSIQIQGAGKPKLSSSGNPMTISLGRALNLLESSGVLKGVVGDNIRILIGIRDESIHFAHNDPELAARIQAIVAASIKNFMTLAIRWFEYNFRQFNFYITPVSFLGPDLNETSFVKTPGRANFLKFIDKYEQTHANDESTDFFVALRLETRLIKTSSDEALEFRLTNNPDAPVLHIAEEDALKGYPYTYRKLTNVLRARYKNFKENSKFHDLKRKLEREGNKFCKIRALDPNNPKSTFKCFYHSRIIEEFDKFYERN